MRCHRLVFLLLLWSTGLALASPQSHDTNPDFDLGIQAYKNSRYEEAAQHFERAVSAEPANAHARLYLATAYAQQYFPGSREPNNTRLANAAIGQYKKVLELDSNNLDAIKGAARLNLGMKEFNPAKEYSRKAIEIDPKDPESYYLIAVIDWTQTYQPRMEQRAKLGLKPEQSMINRAECWEVRAANWDTVGDGIDMLKKAIELRRDYDDAMAYMNLMYRERADIQCGDTKARASDLKMADDWVDMTLAVKKRKAQSQQRTDTQFSTVPSPQ